MSFPVLFPTQERGGTVQRRSSRKKNVLFPSKKKKNFFLEVNLEPNLPPKKKTRETMHTQSSGEGCNAGEDAAFFDSLCNLNNVADAFEALTGKKRDTSSFCPLKALADALPDDDQCPALQAYDFLGREKKELPSFACPYCHTPNATLIGGAGTGFYAYGCYTCMSAFNMSREPDASGQYRFRASKRSFGGGKRRGNGYKCGACGEKKSPIPGLRHICKADAAYIGKEGSFFSAGYDAFIIGEKGSELWAEEGEGGGEEDGEEKGGGGKGEGEGKREGDGEEKGGGGEGGGEGKGEEYGGGEEGEAEGSEAKKARREQKYIRTGLELFNILDLVEHKVMGDGSCWVYAILACAGLCEHADARSDNPPTQIDRARDKMCREMTHSFLQRNKTSIAESDIATLDDILRVPSYPIADDDDYGSFGSNVTILGLVGCIKTSVVIWNKGTIGVEGAMQQVFSWNGDRAEEVLMTPTHILEKKGEAIHIMWNGVDHYTALVGQRLPRFEASVHDSLAKAAPLPGKGGDDWVCFQNMIRCDPQSRREVKGVEACSEEELKKMCIKNGYNSILSVEQPTAAVYFMQFDACVTEEDCDKAGDFSNRFYLYRNPNKVQTACPPSKSCFCNVHYMSRTVLVECESCKRWIHQKCTPYADLTTEALDSIRFVCSLCK